jgi:type I restriction enzyme, S subunit
VSWPLVSISEFCKTSSGGTPSRKQHEYYDGDIPWIKSGDLREKTVDKATEFISELAVQNSSVKIVPKGAILLAMYGATVGRMAMLGIDAATNQAVCSIIPDEESAFPKYVYYALLAKVPEFLRNAVGGAQPNISQGMVKDTKIVLPPLPEQKRIAAILDKADAIRRKRQQAIQLADEFLRSMFLDMFGDPVTNLKGWEKAPLERYFKIGTGGTPSRANQDNYGGSIAWVKTTEVCNEMILETSETISEKGLSSSNCKIYPKGSIIIAMYGQGKTRGQCGILGIDAATNQACAVLEPSETLEMNFVYQYIKYSYEQLRDLGRGGNQPNLNLSLVKSFEIIKPDRDLQTKFSNIYMKVQKLLNINNNFEKDDLFNSLSQKAFAGEL